MSLLVLGGTGTLGRQIVRKALNEGFHVKCFVRNFRKASFLKEWGAQLVYGDLALPETIPLTLYGITAIIDASTTRANNLQNAREIDLYGKYIFIQSAIKAKIKRYIFFSFLNAYKYPDIPLIKLKLNMENRLQESRLNYTVFYLAGFFQGIIPQYAIPILDKKSVWITGEHTPIAYINTQDIANMVVKSLSIEQFNNNIFPIVGSKAWSSSEIIQLCEKISGQKAKIAAIPYQILKIVQSFTNFFQWSWNISERLAFMEVLSQGDNFITSMQIVYKLLQINENNIESLETYLQEYFGTIMKKLKELNYEQFSNINSSLDDSNF
uniref:NmrA-like domain-containing protein n=1 Tax=Sphondylothamnion multifidum TaxID=193186 RepID=A0A4D6X4U6_9FLOR|nr:hypothetical protein [Sphondylothamnion multifidum]